MSKDIKIGNTECLGVDTLKAQELNVAEGTYVTFTLQKESQTKEVVLSTTSQTITADAGFELTSVTVPAVTSAIDSDIIPENIKKGVDILGTVGTLENSSAIIDVATADEMSAKLVEANVGKMYRFTGTTDSTYTNGDLYEAIKLHQVAIYLSDTTDDTYSQLYINGTQIGSGHSTPFTIFTVDPITFSREYNYDEPGRTGASYIDIGTIESGDDIASLDYNQSRAYTPVSDMDIYISIYYEDVILDPDAPEVEL